MRNLLKWSGIGMVAAGIAVLAVRWATELSRRMDQGLAHAEAMTADARQAAQKTADALGHTEEAMRAVRGST